MTKLGVSGTIAKLFLKSEITPLLALVGLLLGLFAVLVTPREEEPQIDVTFVNVFVAFPGATATEVEHLVATPGEQVLSELSGVKHVYSVSRPGMAVFTVEFEVGEPRIESIVRVYNAVFSKSDWLPADLGVAQPIIKPKGIDDVPIVTLTLWTERDDWSSYELAHVAHTLEAELKRIPGTRDVYTVGGPDDVVHVTLDPQRLAGYGLSIDDLRGALQAANFVHDAGHVVADNLEIPVKAGTFLSRQDEVASLVVGSHNGGAIYLSDVATVKRGPDQPNKYTWLGGGPAAEQKGIAAKGQFPAVTIAIAKKPGTNAVRIAEQVIEQFDKLQGIVVPEGVNATVTRNYGETANDKAMTLIVKLAFATASVILLVLFALGMREAFIVGSAVVVTLMITLFASWVWGFTLNRVSLFALIFSIGILVDDAIVVVENIHRHRLLGGKPLSEAIPAAVDEVGGPTILATFTVVAALLPMAFVSGLMGPYMSPIPINASTGMVISLAVAFVFTPWLTLKMFTRQGDHGHAAHGEAVHPRMQRVFHGVMSPFLTGSAARFKRWVLLGVVMVAILVSVSLAGVQWVVLKMLPFDNKSEFQVVVDMPEGTTLETTAAVLEELGDYMAGVPEVTDYQVYAGTAAPINFNGLVRQYYLRSGSNVGDIQVNLVDKKARERKSHEIARDVRAPLHAIAKKYDANVKVVEVPPGPPVMSPLVAEIYGIDYTGQIQVAKQVRQIFEGTDEVLDVDDSVESDAMRYIVQIDRKRAAHLGLNQQQIVSAIATAMGGQDISYLRDRSMKYAVPIRIELPLASKADVAEFLNLKVRNANGALVPLIDVVSVERRPIEKTVYHKDLIPVVFVTGDVSGKLDSPLYGMFSIASQLESVLVDGENPVDQYYFTAPQERYRYGLKWDGEWQITFETFRDMGLAYGVGIVLIYLLVVAQFRSYLVPLIIMAPIPLTIIGVMPGHALLGAPFTATSMIGMIALAGIIVRNSILLVDFINESVAQGRPFETAVIEAATVRAKPILLTAIAAMLGALFILDDPIFNGLAISLLFGILVSTLLTLIIIPVMYYAFMRKRIAPPAP